jgi:isopentenyl diphosphate isomerase/L-lactate dehydrogenase-like FMN-dependent dehydrogenase
VPETSEQLPAISIGPGLTRQSAIYRAGVAGRRPTVPTDAPTLEARAKRRMSPRAWAYIAGGAGEERTVHRNRAAFDKWQVVPRMGVGAADRDLSVELFGRTLPAPVLLAPIGACGLVRPDADLLTARASAATGAPYVFSNQGSSSMEECAAAMDEVEPGAARWFQLYWSKDEGLVQSLLDRAAAIDAGAVVVTLDTTQLGWRPRDLNLGSLPFSRGIGIAQYTRDGRFRELVRDRIANPTRGPKPDVTLAAVKSLLDILRNHPGGFLDNLRSPEPRAAVETFLDVYSNPGLSWEHLETLRGRTDLPIVLKGILHPDDARRALDLGVDGIVVSNHGGRQVDNAIASLDALVTIRDAIGPEPTVLLDSGVRTGADVYVARALGADAVLLGRSYVYGMALAGQQGIEDVIQNVVAELDLTMGLTGVRDLAGITRELVQPATS